MRIPLHPEMANDLLGKLPDFAGELLLNENISTRAWVPTGTSQKYLDADLKPTFFHPELTRLHFMFAPVKENHYKELRTFSSRILMIEQWLQVPWSNLPDALRNQICHEKQYDSTYPQPLETCWMTIFEHFLSTFLHPHLHPT